ncbi:MAG: tRNA (adenosine(37)-N6)-threonylcarbamoyltransferase complex ATPase subunit type 1 TsaE [Candidatus Portnoybacteria bacterium]|nr:tRNA (adenosine(37)-N6)-threonylcarbamoyltransferase complex ATPase subunit type 1 TsaE [Candidatus Portnoybacteria bacterium]
METKTFLTKNARETQKVAGEIVGSLLKKNRTKAAVLALEGELGGGKTTFVQGLVDIFELKVPITSPTFVVMKRYEIGNPEISKIFKNLYHADCYRLEHSQDLAALGFGEIIKNPENLIIVEWADKVREIIPDDAAWIKFEWMGEEERKIEIKSII